MAGPVNDRNGTQINTGDDLLLAGVARSITNNEVLLTLSNGQVLRVDGPSTIRAADIKKSSDYLPLAGGTMTGDIATGGNDITGLDTLKVGSAGAAAATIHAHSASEPTLELEQDSNGTPFIDFDSEIAADLSTSITSRTTSGALLGYLRVRINGSINCWLAVFLDPPAPG